MMAEHDPEQQHDDADTPVYEAESDGADALEALGDAAPEQPPEQNALERLQSERDALESQLLRVSADYQNFAKRAQQNVNTAVEQKLMDVARGLVVVLDHFDRALEAAGAHEADQQDDLHKGVTMVYEEMLATLGRYGVTRVQVQPGEAFDPVRHEALMRQPSDEVEPNHVTMQLLPGYMLGEKVVRPAQVGVAE